MDLKKAVQGFALCLTFPRQFPFNFFRMNHVVLYLTVNLHIIHHAYCSLFGVCFFLAFVLNAYNL